MLIMVIFVLKFTRRCAKSIISALNQPLPKRKLDKRSFHVIDKLEHRGCVKKSAQLCGFLALKP